MICTGCGAALETNWSYCRFCGHPRPSPATARAGRTPRAAKAPQGAPVEALAATDGGPPLWARVRVAGGRIGASVGRRDWRHLAPVGLVAAGFVALAVLIGGALFLAQSRADTAEARSGLRDTQSELTAAQREVESLKAELEQTQRELGVRTMERDGLRAELGSVQDAAETLRTDLSSTRNNLQQTQTNLQQVRQQTTLQTGQISILKSCLSGVSQALDYAATNRWPVAQQVLQAVQGNCQQASALF